jgi:hypothetical protein
MCCCSHYGHQPLLSPPQGNISCNAAGGSLCFVTGAVGLFAASHIANAIAIPDDANNDTNNDNDGDGSSRPWEDTTDGDPSRHEQHQTQTQGAVNQRALDAHRKGRTHGNA